MGDGRRGIFSAGEEIRETGNQADVDLRAHGPQALGEDLQSIAHQHLGGLHRWTIGTIGWIHVPLHVGVADEAVAKLAGHLEPDEQREGEERGQ